MTDELDQIPCVFTVIDGEGRNVLACRVMPGAETQAISFIHPHLLMRLAVIFPGEGVGHLGWAAVLPGFSGGLIIVRPGGVLFGLRTAFDAEGAEKNHENAKAYGNATAHREGETGFSRAPSATPRSRR